MKKITVLLIFTSIVILINGCIIFRSLKGRISQSLKSDMPIALATTPHLKNNTSDIYYKSMTIDLSENPIRLSNNSSTSAQINANTDSPIQAMDLYLRYDTRDISIVDIYPGDFFTNGQIFLKNIDKTNGYADVTIGSTIPSRLEGAVVNIIIQSKNSQKRGIITLAQNSLASDGSDNLINIKQKKPFEYLIN